MASRPIFIPDYNGLKFVKEQLVEFEWHPGFAKIQAQKSVRALHEAAAKAGIGAILEISSKSIDALGVSLSAFNLKFQREQKYISVECAYQGSKIFANGGPYVELYFVSSKEAKTDPRLYTSGEFVGYEFFGESFTANPVTAFYDWLYLTALSQNLSLSSKLLNYEAFSDIAFNPKKSLNCQARAAALYVSLCKGGEIERVIEDKDYYLNLVTNKNSNKSSSAKDVREKTKEEYIQLQIFP